MEGLENLGLAVANLASDGRDGLGGIHASVSLTPTQARSTLADHCAL